MNIYIVGKPLQKENKDDYLLQIRGLISGRSSRRISRSKNNDLRISGKNLTVITYI